MYSYNSFRSIYIASLLLQVANFQNSILLALACISYMFSLQKSGFNYPDYLRKLCKLQKSLVSSVYHYYLLGSSSDHVFPDINIFFPLRHEYYYYCYYYYYYSCEQDEEEEEEQQQQQLNSKLFRMQCKN